MTTTPITPPYGLSAATRRWIYSIVLACAPLAVTLGFTDNTTAGLIVGVFAAVLGGGLALPNVSDPQPPAATPLAPVFDAETAD